MMIKHKMATQKFKSLPISVVIPSLGGDVLQKTIKALNNSTLTPSEIILCIPETEANSGPRYNFSNVKVIKTKVRGQVAQRAIGLTKSKENIVLQLDDDILVEKKTIEVMTIALIAKGPKNVMGPIYYSQPDYKYCLHRFPIGFLGWLRSLEAKIICNAPWGITRMGKNTQIGIAYGVDPEYLSEEHFQTDWLPGGCVLSYKQDLVLEQFYPFPGKAYNEDLIHSILRRRQNITHWVVSQAKCSTDIFWNIRQFDDLKKDIKSKRYILDLMNSNTSFRFKIWLMIEYLKESMKRITKRPGSWLNKSSQKLSVKE
jgi:glycosyltransferase involved in cell wall biosynthesis